jgi:Predicted HD-superfamily hydrolase
MEIFIISVLKKECQSETYLEIKGVLSNGELVKLNCFQSNIPTLKTWYDCRIEPFNKITISGQNISYMPPDYVSDIISQLKPTFDDYPQVTVDKVIELIKDKLMMRAEERHLREIFYLMSNFPAVASHHHTQKGGLLTHTYEVIQTFLDLCKLPVFQHISEYEVLIGIYASIFHDIGKMKEYVELPNETFQFIKSNKSIPHTVTSLEYWNTFCKSFTFDKDFIEQVNHCIASHHGLFEWGSPVAPHTRPAYLLHTADMLSTMGWKSRFTNENTPLEFPYQRSK